MFLSLLIAMASVLLKEAGTSPNHAKHEESTQTLRVTCLKSFGQDLDGFAVPMSQGSHLEAEQHPKPSGRRLGADSPSSNVVHAGEERDESVAQLGSHCVVSHGL